MSVNLDLDTLKDPQVLAEFLLPLATSLLSSLAVLFIGLMVAKWLRNMLKRGMTKGKMDETLAGFLSKVFYGLAVAVIVITALGQLGVNTTSAAALLGGAALAIGLSLQGQLSSLAAGVMLIIFRPFKKGDTVQVDGLIGTVQEINIINTILTNLENQVVTLPNSSVFGNTIINITTLPWRRANLTIGISYGSDLRKAKAILERLMAEDERILKDPAPAVWVTELADSSVNFAVRPCMNTPDFWATRCELIEKIKLTFDEEGIEIPFPQMDVHVRDTPDSEAAATKA